MEADQTIERIKILEEEGKKQMGSAETKAAGIIKKAKEEAVILVEEYEKTKDSEIKEKMLKIDADVKKDSEKIISKAEKEAQQIKESAKAKISNVSKKLFEVFRKELLS